MNQPIPQLDPRYTIDREENINFLHYWRVIRKYLFEIIGLAIAVGILAALVANSMIPVYTATTKVSIERVTPATGGTTGINWYAMQKYPGTQYQILKSKSVAKQVVESLKLWEHPYYNKAKTEGVRGWRRYLPFLKNEKKKEDARSEEQKLADKKKALVAMVQGGISVNPVKDTYVVEISFSSSSPELAALIANGVVDAYIKRNLDARFREVKKISDWMTKSLGGISTQLDSSEGKLQQYRSKENLLDVGKGASGFLTEQLDDLSNKVIKERIVNNQLKVLKRQADRFSKMPLEEVLNNPSIYKHPTLSELKTVEVAATRKLAELKKRYGPKHPKMKQAMNEVEAIQDRYRQLIPSIIRGIDEDFEVSRQNLASLEKQYEALKKKVQSANVKGFELDRLKQDVEGNRKLRDLFMEEYKQTSLNSSFETDRVRVVDAAMVPSAPSRPNKRRIVMMAVLVAIFVGIGLAFLIDYLDQTIRTSEDTERKLGLITMGLLPQLSKKKIRKGDVHPERAYFEDESSNFSETIRTIRTSVALSALDHPHKVILSTSSVPGEGKTTVACNLALSMSQLEKTLIFDADMRRPSAMKIFGYDHRSPGMSELLAGEAEFKDVLHKVEGTNLHVITAGAVPIDPLDLLASNKFKLMLGQLAKVYDRIVIDSPPVSMVSDAVLLSNLADAVIYVIKSDSTNTKIINATLQKLRRANAHVIGAVINNVDIKKMSKYYGYGYGKYYGSGYYSYGEEYRKA
ncbi:MAG: polysaccharide biosynthesis tyrosine autokinase [Gammaproteobacteria bacterium]|nr:polysaccharide biosynthesis tyrosine autokinase [Gammaproteobacteria bacterium]